VTPRQREALTWVADPDDEGAGRSVTWHATREILRLDGMSNVASPELISPLCRVEALPRHRITRTSQLLPEPRNQDHLCGRCMHPDLRIPDGWPLEVLPRMPDHALLSTPLPIRCMATIDFRARGIRTGYSVTGPFLGEEWNTRRKKYDGRGWRQAIVDDAVAHLREVLR
jgi:hypothetical protein